MKRTKYFNHTRPGQDQLNYTETCRVNSMLERTRANFQFGISSGFRVTVNGADATKIDISNGEAYTGGFYKASNLRGVNAGERIYTETVAILGQALADYTNGVKNYVSLVYIEVESTPLPERFYPATSHDTIVDESFTLSALSETNWNLLTAEQKQGRVLVAIVTAKGAGVALTLADIDQLVQAKTHPTAAQPSNITGVTIVRVTGTTPQGTATLTFTAPNVLRYTAPGDSIGAATTVSSSGEWTVYSSTTAYAISVDVIYANLPTVDATDSIEISSLYGRNIPLACTADVAHRDMVGSGAVTTNNPHGLSLVDVQGGLLTHADYFHINAINRNANSGELLGAIAPGDVVQVANLGGSTNTFLIDGVEYELINGKSAGEEGEAAFTASDTSGDYIVYLDSAARVQKVLVATFTPTPGFIGDPVLWTTAIELYDMRNDAVGTAVVTWDATARTLQYTAPGDAIGTAVYVNPLTVGGTDWYGYYKLYSHNATDWVIVFVNGNLGGSNASTFTTNKAETTASDESILKISIVTWDAINSNLRNIRDIRPFMSADDTEELVKEHDTDGFHTKELRNTLRIGVESYGLHAIAESDSAVIGIARSGTAGVYGQAPYMGVQGVGVSVGVYGNATGVGVLGVASNIAVSAQATSNAPAGTITAIYAEATNAGAAAAAIAIRGSAAGTGVLGEGATGVYATGVYGIYAVPDYAGGAAGTAYGAYVGGADLSDDQAEYYGICHSASGDAAKAIDTAYCISNSFFAGTASTLCGYYATLTCNDNKKIYGIAQSILVDAAGSADNLYVYSARASVTKGESAWLNYGSLSVGSVKYLQGIENLVQYKTCTGGLGVGNANAAVFSIYGETARYPTGMWVINNVLTSAEYVFGINNFVKYEGAAVVPAGFYGYQGSMDVTNGAFVANNFNILVVSSAIMAQGFRNSVYATQAQSIYGHWQQVENGNGVTCAELVGRYSKVHGGDASQALCKGDVIDVTGNVDGVVYGVQISATNEGAAKTAYGMSVTASAAVGYGIRVDAPTYAVYGVAGAANGIGGIFQAGAANGIGVSAIGKSVGIGARATTGPATAGLFDATVAGGTAIIGLGLAKGAYIAAGDAGHGTAITAVHAVATADEALTTVIGVYGYATNVAVAGNQYGVYGSASHAQGCGVVGFAAKGIGVYASGSEADMWCAHGSATAALRFDQYYAIIDWGGHAFGNVGAIKVTIGGVGAFWIPVGTIA